MGEKVGDAFDASCSGSIIQEQYSLVIWGGWQWGTIIGCCLDIFAACRRYDSILRIRSMLGALCVRS